MTRLRTMDATVIKTHEWIQDIQDEGHFKGEQEAYAALRGVLHALRDRLLTDEVAEMGAQLPIFIRGIYYEGWVPSHTPLKIRTRQDFLDNVASRLPQNIDLMVAIQAVLKVIQRKITDGEINDVKSNLPQAILELWPES